MTISIAAEFTRTPGPRYRNQGPSSGQEFRDKYLKPKFQQALQAHDKITIQLDGVKYGYPTSFLEEAFGGLAREFGVKTVLDTLRFESHVEPMLDDEIRHYIKHANDVRGI